MNFFVVIPARYDSSRLPGKPLKDIAGKPMIQHVYENARKSSAKDVVVATDDSRILNCVEKFGGRALLTSKNHTSGTERVQEAANILNLSLDDIVVNVQGDEPLLPASAIHQVADMLIAHPEASIATLCEPIHDLSDIQNPHQVKVVKSQSGRALYFSRVSIPASSKPNPGMHYRHIGLYAYRADFLRDFRTWEPTSLEMFERLEQLRALEHDRLIQVDVALDLIPPGVDTEHDLDVVRKYLESPSV